MKIKQLVEQEVKIVFPFYREDQGMYLEVHEKYTRQYSLGYNAKYPFVMTFANENRVDIIYKYAILDEVSKTTFVDFATEVNRKLKEITGE